MSSWEQGEKWKQILGRVCPGTVLLFMSFFPPFILYTKSYEVELILFLLLGKIRLKIITENDKIICY